mmetsp:Transcript_124867/g.216540  ORF Transcript_124867/g.216540 Transcript_124867/m.216540 type:complete len:107 (+) Transcript_124867:505-825(+)
MCPSTASMEMRPCFTSTYLSRSNFSGDLARPSGSHVLPTPGVHQERPEAEEEPGVVATVSLMLGWAPARCCGAVKLCGVEGAQANRRERPTQAKLRIKKARICILA